MRMIMMALAATALSAMAAPGGAAPVPGKALVELQNIVPVANGCGVGWHWVPGYRRWDGFRVPGRCVRNW